MNTQSSWPARLTRSIAGQVKRHRTKSDISAQQLSEACAKLGLEIPRSTIADLENGRRASISVAELLVLARALGVAPLLLVFPVGSEAESEVLPGELRSPFRAALWAAGEAPFPGPDDAAYITSITEDWNAATANPLALYRAHLAASASAMRALGRARAMDERAVGAAAGEREGFTEAAAALRETAERHQAAADSTLRRAAELGLVAPESM
jgi:transcriptional regulator with XRE-family HTH domain